MLPLLLVLCASAVRADVDEDMARGVVAYQRGDIVAAIAHFRDAALRDHAPAQVRLAYILHRSDRIPQAMAWYRRAARQQSAEAQFALGQMYLTGEAGESDTLLARTWTLAAAANGHPPAMRALVTAHERGGMALPRDPEQARYWLERAAAHGDGWAAARLRQATDERED